MNSPIMRAAFQPAPPVKVMIPLGACLDIPTGTYVEGPNGEMILNGGLGNLTGVAGIGNNFKSTFMHFMFLTAMSRCFGSNGQTYDTEMNMHEWHLKKLYGSMEAYQGEDILESGRWVITDKTMYEGDEYWEIAKDFMKDKIKNADKIKVKTGFMNRERKDHLYIPVPTFSEIDSFSEFTTSDVIKMQDDNALGESGANMVSMRQGIQKNRVLMEIPSLAGGSYNYTLFTAHIGAEFSMDPRNPPPKKLQHLKGGVKLKGVPEKFTFVMHNCWHCYNAAPLVNDSTKAPEYPRDSDDAMKGDTDLNVVTIRNLRCKSGPTGMAMELIVSQQEGVLPSLTEFHHIKNQGRYGFEGNMQNYNLILCPDIKLSRTAVRRKIDSEVRLRRALNILSEMCQMSYMWHQEDIDAVMCTPEELYNDIKALGYNWDWILENTQGWMPIGMEPEKHHVSTLDLLRMRKLLYVPHSFPADQIPESVKDVPRKKVF